MSNIHDISDLEPQELWRHFAKICTIPHLSNQEEKLAKYIKTWAEHLGLEAEIDAVNNVVVRKPATKGMEDRKPVILQGHLDMVGQKTPTSNHDFAADPIKPKIEGGWVKATDTTLGADNGIGIAAAMVILESKNIEHGPIEALFTVDEESGFTGINAITPNLLHGDILLNMDTEEEGTVYISSAGGVTSKITFDYLSETTPANQEGFTITVNGLKGGHSGADIHLGLGNANKFLTHILWESANKFNLRLSKFNGGDHVTAITRHATATVAVPKENSEEFVSFVTDIAKSIFAEYESLEPKLVITTEPCETPKIVVTEDCQFRFLNALYACPSGVIKMSKAVPGLVAASTNLGVIKTEEDSFVVIISPRAETNFMRDDITNMVESIFRLAGAKIEHLRAYSAWQPNTKSEILRVMQETYQEVFNTPVKVKAIHAGLECAHLVELYPNLDMISFGPTIIDPHSPSERVNIESVHKFWRLLVATLANIPRKTA